MGKLINLPESLEFSMLPLVSILQIHLDNLFNYYSREEVVVAIQCPEICLNNVLLMHVSNLHSHFGKALVDDYVNTIFSRVA